MKIKLGLLLSCIVVLATFSLHAQPSAPTATEQTQNFQQSTELQQPMMSLTPGTNAPEIYPGENEDIGPQHILRLLPRRTYFEVKVDSEYLYTDNAMLSQHPTVSSTIFVNTISAALAPTAYKLGDGRFAPTAGVLSQWYNYGLGGHDVSFMDFNVQTFFVGGKYIMQNNWLVFGEFDYSRYLNQHSYGEFYHDFTPSIGVQKLVQLRNDLVLAASLRTDYHVSYTVNPPHNSQDCMDDALSLSLSYQVMPRFVVQPYYRFQYTYYRFDTAHASGRNDFLNSFGVSASYYFTPNLSLRVFVNDDIKETDDALVPKYHDYNVGADLAYSIRF